MRVALCQIPVSSRPDINSERVRAALGQAADGGADLEVFPQATQIRFGSDLPSGAPAADGTLWPQRRQPGTRGGASVRHGNLACAGRSGRGERDQRAPGSAPVICTLAGMRTGLQICYDVRFGELSRALAVGGASLLVLPAAWAAGLFKEDHWVTLVRARAIENTVWVAAVGQVPDPDEPPT